MMEDIHLGYWGSAEANEKYKNVCAIHSSFSISRSLRVEYNCGFKRSISEWLLLERVGFPRKKAEQWWRQRSTQPVPETVDLALALIESFPLREPYEVTVDVRGKYPKLLGMRLSAEPGTNEPSDPAESREDRGNDAGNLDDIPF